jgi:hypothetical protein
MALNLRPHDTERLLRWSYAAAARKNDRRRAKGEPELTDWGPSWYGLPPDVLAAMGGEDPAEYVPVRRRRRGPWCECEFGQACAECITVEEIEHANRYGILCPGDRYCDLCFDPDLHLTERQRASIGL